MSDAVLAAMIEVAGSVLGAFAVVLAAHIQAAHKAALMESTEKPGKEPVLGDAVDIRELRILRALFGEPRGRWLAAYQDGYYGPSLKAVVQKEWVEQNGKRYNLTPKGAKFCQAYLKELFKSW